MFIRRTLLPLACLISVSALAQSDISESEAEGVRVFYPDYFEEFDPFSALEMVYRTPGFNPQERDGGRGLSDVRTNVLINGERPPPKGQSIRQQLGEMPISRVDRIELIDSGARLDIDMQGYPQVVNVITFPDAPAYYEFTSEIQRSGDGTLDQDNERDSKFESIGSFFRNGNEFTLRADYRDRVDQPPANLIDVDPANPEQRISSINKSEREDYGLDFNALWNLNLESSLSLNSRLSTRDQVSYPVPLEGAVQDEDAIDRSSGGNNENRDISAEYRGPMGDNGSMMIAFVDAQSNDQSESTFSSSDLNRTSLNDRESGETALRFLVTRTPTPRLTLRTTATGAYNYFEGDFRLFENGVEQIIEGSANRVEEDRYTLDAATDWTPAEKWTVTAQIGMETYNIQSLEAASGTHTDAISDLTVQYRPQPRTTLSFESSRDIGQLSFNQFLASSNLSSEILTAGASALEPERNSRNRVRYDRRFGDDGVMRFTLSRDETSNPVRQVALSDSLIISQNTSPEKSYSFNSFIQFPFARFGREDLIASFEGQIVDSETIDPVTGELRARSGQTRRYWTFEMRRDPGDSRLAWAFNVQGWVEDDRYGVRTTQRDQASREWGAWVEWEPIPDLKIRTSVNGPRRWIGIESLYPSVRAIGLEPSFYTTTESYTDRSASIRIEWRRKDHIEIRGTISSQPSNLRLETLTPFGGIADEPFRRRVATTPQVTLRVRVYR